MNRGKRLGVSLLLTGVIGLSSIQAYGEEDAIKGRIYGRVKNGTTGESVTDLELTLRIFEGSNITEQQQGFLDEEGNFSFVELEPGETKRYALYAVYQGVDYYSPLFIFDEQHREFPYELIVYEPTDSDRYISAAMHHVVVGLENDGIWIKEIIVLENTDNTVYVGTQEIKEGKRETFRVSLPFGAKQLQLGEGLQEYYVFVTEDGFVDTRAILPGTKRIEFLYKLDYGLSKIELAKTVHFITDSFDVFVPDTGIQAESQDLKYVGLVGEPGQQFLHFSGTQFAKGSHIAFTLQSLPWKKRAFKIFAPSVGIILLGLGFLYPLLRRWKLSDGYRREVEETEGASRFLDERQRLLWSIAELDEQLEAGQISSEEHHQQRQILKKHVVELTRTSQRGSRREEL